MLSGLGEKGQEHGPREQMRSSLPAPVPELQCRTQLDKMLRFFRSNQRFQASN